MSRELDLAHLARQAAIPPPRVGSGIIISVPDGAGGQNNLPVELATFKCLDQILGTLQQILEALSKINTEGGL